MRSIRKWPFGLGSLLALAFLTTTPEALGNILDPMSFPSLGAFPSAPGTYTFDTEGGWIYGPGGLLLVGSYTPYGDVFDFDSISMPASNVNIVFEGYEPIILLSRSDMTINWNFNVENMLMGHVPAQYSPGTEWLGGYVGGRGGGAGATFSESGSGPGAGQASWSLSGGGGGGFGGAGGGGGAGGRLPGAGGVANGDLFDHIQGGSGGGGGGGSIIGEGNYGGNGGGAIELVAAGTLNFSGSILADGQAGLIGYTGGAGGGSGGGIILAGSSVVLSNAVLSARGGDGAIGAGNVRGPAGGGGGGGGGRILIASAPGGLEIRSSTLDVSPGRGGDPGLFEWGTPPTYGSKGTDGQAGTITIMLLPVPEPSSAGLLVLGAAGFALLRAGRRSRRMVPVLARRESA